MYTYIYIYMYLGELEERAPPLCHIMVHLFRLELNKRTFRPRGIGARESESQGPERVVGLWK